MIVGMMQKDAALKLAVAMMQKDAARKLAVAVSADVKLLIKQFYSQLEMT